MSVTRINIRLNASSSGNNGVIVNTYDLSEQERSKKNLLYAPQQPVSDNNNNNTNHSKDRHTTQKQKPKESLNKKRVEPH